MRFHHLLALFLVSFVCVFPAKAGSFSKTPKTTVEGSVSQQIPDDILVKMPTEELLQKCVIYPYIVDYYICRGEFPEFDLLNKEYNGYAELFRRDDFVNVLLREYQDLPNQIEKTLKANDSEKGALSFKYLIYEYMMTGDVFTEKVKKSPNRAEFEPMILKGAEAIRKHPELFSDIHSTPLAKLMDSDIFSDANKSRLASLRDAYGIYVPTVIYTPNGTPIESALEWVGCDYSQGERENLKTRFVNVWGVPRDSIVGDPSLLYNCHAYAWHMSCGGGEVWIDGTDEAHLNINGYCLSPYWNDESYIECSQSEDHDVVLYAGDHSARHLGNGVYESKCGNGPVIRHQLNDALPGYLPSQPKRFFKRFQLSLNGPTIPGSPSTYSVQGLSSDWYVTWSMVGRTTLPNYCTVNYPAANQLQINNSSKRHIKETLVAKVYNASGTLLKTLTMDINTAYGFSGSYTQTAFSDVLSGPVNDGSNIQVRQGYNVVLTSSDFNGATVSYTSLRPYPTISTSGNTVTVRLHASTAPSSCLLHCVNGDKVIEFSLRADASMHLDPDPPIIASISGSGNSTINIELTEQTESSEPMRESALDSWELDIYSLTSGKHVYAQRVSGPSVSIDTSKWEPDVYIVHIKVGGKEILQKFSLEHFR